MIITRNGFVVMLLCGPDPKIPGTVLAIFGPTISHDRDLPLENLTTNGLTVFPTMAEVQHAVEASCGWQKEFTKLIAEVEIKITDGERDWEELRGYGSYIVALGHNLYDLSLFGSAWADGQRVPGAHDARASFPANGLRPFTDFKMVVGEKGLGVTRELARQSAEPVRLIGIKFL